MTMVRRPMIGAWATRFLRDEDGSQTVEAVIWVPIFITMVALVINVSLVFFDQSQILRVAQDANRALSLGALQNVDEAEAYIIENLRSVSDEVDVEAVIEGRFVTTTIRVPAGNLMPIRIPISYFSDTTVTVVAKHFLEV